MAYLILLGRTQSAEFSLNILQLAALTAFLYIISVFVVSYRFEADLFPFYSLLRCFAEKSITPLWLNISGQIVGSILGLNFYLLMHKKLLALSPLADTTNLTLFEIHDTPMRSLIMVVLVFILVYSMIIIRKLFLLKGMTGTTLIAILVFVLSAISFPIKQVSVVTWLPDTVLSYYHYLIGSRELNLGLSDLVTGGVLVVTIYLAHIKASQYVRPRTGDQEFAEPGEFSTSFNKDYDI